MWLVKFLRWGDTQWLRDAGALGTRHVCTRLFFFVFFLVIPFWWEVKEVGWLFFLKGCQYLYALKILYFIIYSLTRTEFSLWLLYPSQSAMLVLLSSLESLVGKWSTWYASSHLTSLWKLIQKEVLVLICLMITKIYNHAVASAFASNTNEMLRLEQTIECDRRNSK